MRFLIPILIVALTVACGSSNVGSGDAHDAGVETGQDATLVCEPGKQEACTCPGGTTSGQRCREDGSGWYPCPCPDAGAPEADAGEAAGDAAEELAVDAPQDTASEPQPECTAAGDCPGETTSCAYPKCSAGVCSMGYDPAGTWTSWIDECKFTECDGAGVEVVANEPMGKVLANQTHGDCMKALCDGAGNVTSMVDLSDLPSDDGNECTEPACSATGPEMVPRHGAYCDSVCTEGPCGVSDPTQFDSLWDWGVCDGDTCKEYLTVKCFAEGTLYRGCWPLAANSYTIGWDTYGPEDRCIGPYDRGYCAPGTPCWVSHNTLGLLYGNCQ